MSVERGGQIDDWTGSIEEHRFTVNWWIMFILFILRLTVPYARTHQTGEKKSLFFTCLPHAKAGRLSKSANVTTFRKWLIHFKTLSIAVMMNEQVFLLSQPFQAEVWIVKYQENISQAVFLYLHYDCEIWLNHNFSRQYFSKSRLKSISKGFNTMYYSYPCETPFLRSGFYLEKLTCFLDRFRIQMRVKQHNLQITREWIVNSM